MRTLRTDKEVRLSSQSRVETAKAPGGEIFTDVCGPLHVQSLSGKSYSITFSDAMSPFK